LPTIVPAAAPTSRPTTIRPAGNRRRGTIGSSAVDAEAVGIALGGCDFCVRSGGAGTRLDGDSALTSAADTVSTFGWVSGGCGGGPGADSHCETLACWLPATEDEATDVSVAASGIRGSSPRCSASYRRLSSISTSSRSWGDKPDERSTSSSSGVERDEYRACFS
jgi:hypothetical protein